MAKHIDTECRDCLTSEFSIFKGLEPALAARLRADASVRRFRHRQIICSEGSPVQAVHCVIEGAVKVSRVGERSEQQVLRLLGPGGAVGVRPLMAGDRYAASAEATGGCVVCRVPRATFQALLDASSVLVRNVATWLARELRVSEDLLMVMTQRTVKRRVGDLLLLLHGEAIEGDDWTPLPPVKLSRQELAEMAGTTPETLSRVLAEFAARRLISLTRQDITILDAAELHSGADPKRPRV